MGGVSCQNKIIEILRKIGVKNFTVDESKGGINFMFHTKHFIKHDKNSKSLIVSVEHVGRREPELGGNLEVNFLLVTNLKRVLSEMYPSRKIEFEYSRDQEECRFYDVKDSEVLV